MNDPISEASFWIPERIVTSGWLEHAPFGFWLIDALRPETFVELGTHEGYSYFVFNQAFRALGIKARRFAIDTWQGDEHAGFYGPEVLESVRAYNDENYWDFSELVRSTFDDALNLFEDETIDLLHIDGRHFYEDVRDDFEAWKPKLSPRAVVVFHDTNVRVKQFGVHRLWKELAAHYQHFEFLHGHGLGIIGVGTDLPEALISLFSASDDPAKAKRIQSIYSRLGETISSRAQLRAGNGKAEFEAARLQLEAQVASLVAERATAISDLSATEITRRQLEAQLSSLMAERANAISDLSAAETRHQQLKAQLASLVAERTELDLEVVSSKRAREDVDQQLLALRSDCETLHSQLFVAELEHRNLEAISEDLFRSQAENQRLSTQLSELEQYSNQLQAALTQAKEERTRLRSELLAAAGERSVHECNSERYQAEREHLSSQLSKAQSEAEELLVDRSQLKRLLRSTSWRVTSPLRWTAENAPWLTSLLVKFIKLLWWIITLQLSTRLRRSRNGRLLSKSLTFDINFYLERNRDVAESGVNPIAHYLALGASEGRDPNALFDGSWYLERYNDVALAGVNPLVHYLRRGAKEGRDPHALFDTAFYTRQNPGVDSEAVNPLEHYIAREPAEARDPHPIFDGAWYLRQNADVAAARMNPLQHYLDRGWTEGRAPHRLFDGAFYLRQNPDVGEAHINPLLHYVTKGAGEMRDPHPLFDTAYYLRVHPEAVGSGLSPLAHYILASRNRLQSPHPLLDLSFYLSARPDTETSGMDLLSHYLNLGWKANNSPHALFDINFYLEQNPALSDGPVDPVSHYITEGAAKGSDPCCLFQSSFYLRRYPHLAKARRNPLVHFVTDGVHECCNPNPLFDTAFYLARYPDVAASGVNPLVHYIISGAFEGRLPNPFFDSAFYLTKNADVRRAKLNPLGHYLVFGGAEEGRDPGPNFDSHQYVSEHPEIRASGINPLAHFLDYAPASIEVSGLQEPAPIPIPTLKNKFSVRKLRHFGPIRAPENGWSGSPAVVCVTHVFPYPPRAGNEYRIYRMLRRMKSRGYRIFLVVSPLGGESVADEQIRELALELGSAVVYDRSGTVTYCMDEAESAIAALDGLTPPSYSEALDESRCSTARSIELLNIDRTFCPDGLVCVATTLAARLGRYAVLAEYVFMSRLLPLIEPGALKIIDTIDVFSTKQNKVGRYGISDSLTLSSEEERQRLLRADLILAIQTEEQKELEALAAPRGVITVGVDFPALRIQRPCLRPTVLYIGSDNPMNVRGLQDFLRFGWPSVLREIPEAELLVAGRVCVTISHTHKNVSLLGPSSETAALYERAKVTINPSVAGTGLKIKTIEALSNLRPIVTWPNGVDGVDARLASLCHIVTDWYEFHRTLITVLGSSKVIWFDHTDRDLIADRLSPETVYKELEHELEKFFVASEAMSA